MTGKWIGGKGSVARKTDPEKWERGWEAAFGKDKTPMRTTPDAGTFKDFEVSCDKTWRGPPHDTPAVLFTALAICGEAGELAEEVKKYYRDDGGAGESLTAARRKAILLEAGDVLYYLSRMARLLGVTLEDIANMNVTKLYYRHIYGKETNASD